MNNRFGIDLMLSDDSDFIFKADGDLMTTQDYENQKADARFEGYYSVIRAIVNRLISEQGEYPFDPSYGAGLDQRVSAPIDKNFANNISLLVSSELKKDDRVQEVIGVKTEIVAKVFVIINAQVKLIGDEGVSDLVFPRMFIG